MEYYPPLEPLGDAVAYQRTGLYRWCGRPNAYSMESYTVALVWGAALAHMFHRLEDFANGA